MLGRAVFELAFVRYLESIGYHHLRAGGLAGSQTSHEFQRGDEFVALAIVAEGQGDCHIVVESDTVPGRAARRRGLDGGAGRLAAGVRQRPERRGREGEDAVAGQSLAGRLPGRPSRIEGAVTGGKWKKPTQ